jgi:exopolyphosphatase/guanosine-5'-triphosphate,3'-diphosphate pyrophosphatase
VNASLDLNLRPGARRAFRENLHAGTVSSAYAMAKRYNCDLKHAGYVSDLALRLFEKLRRLHGLSRQQRMLLETACILHEVGRFTNTANMKEASFDLIKDAHIYGLHTKTTLLAANIVAPQDILGIVQSGARGGMLDREDMLFVNKMHAILHLADAMDTSHTQKASLLDVRQDHNRLVLDLNVKHDYALERCMLRQSAPLFQEVFGLELDFNIKKSGQSDVAI